MKRRRLFALVPIVTISGPLLSACGRNDPPLVSLEKAVQQLQDNLEAKKTSAVLEQLDIAFRAQRELDRDWAKRTMTLMFLQHQNLRIVAVSRSSRIDAQTPTTGLTDAQVLLTGAQGLVPDQAAPYSVKLQWRLVGKEWKLAKLEWE